MQTARDVGQRIRLKHDCDEGVVRRISRAARSLKRGGQLIALGLKEKETKSKHGRYNECGHQGIRR